MNDRRPFHQAFVRILFIVALVAGPAPAHTAAEREQVGATEIVALVNSRLAGRFVSRKIEMTMTTRKGRTRTRRTGSFRKQDGGNLRSVIYYLSPHSVRGSSFLTHDYDDASEEDDQWLYLPSIRRPRRVAASDRGDYFMGTDFTFDDVKHETDLSATDYRWQRDGAETLDETPCLIIVGEPVDETTAEALGYGRLRVWVSTESWIPIRSEYWDPQGNPIKTIIVSEIRRVDDIWTPHRIEAVRLKNGHRTVFEISDPDYHTEIDDFVFTKRALDSIPARLR